MWIRPDKLHRTIFFFHQLFYVLKWNAQLPQLYKRKLLCCKAPKKHFVDEGISRDFPSAWRRVGKMAQYWVNFSFKSIFSPNLFVSASRAPPAQNGAASYGYPSPGMMNGYGPPPTAPPSYGYPPPGRQNGFYQVPPPVAGNMGYPYPTATAGRGFSRAPLDIYRSTFTEL